MKERRKERENEFCVQVGDIFVYEEFVSDNGKDESYDHWEVQFYQIVELPGEEEEDDE